MRITHAWGSGRGGGGGGGREGKQLHPDAGLILRFCSLMKRFAVSESERLVYG